MCSKPYEEAHEIVSNIWVGSAEAAHDRQWQRRVGITHVVCAAIEIDMAFPTELVYLKLRVFDWDAGDLLPALPWIIAFVKQAIELDGAVLIHW
jgi:hypothetical protein